MKNIARQAVKPVESSDRQQTDIEASNTQQTIPKPLIIAGTSEGLWFLDANRYIELKDREITALASRDVGLWVICDRNSLWHRNFNSEWHQITSMEDVQLNCLLPLQDMILVGTSGACLIRIEDGNANRFNCFEAVTEREQWYTPWGAPPDVRSMAVSQSGEIYVNVHVGGILRSSDRGQSWQPTIDFHADVHEVKTIPQNPDLVLAATAQGLAISTDKGNSWSFDRANLHADYARAVAVCGDTILMTASTGPHTNKAAIYRRSLNQQGTFEKCDRGLPEWFSDNINTGTLATSGNLAAFGTSDGQIFLSNDAGLSWQQIATDLAPIHCLILNGGEESKA